MTGTTEKPRASKGTFCPLWKKDKSKVCHTCEFWVRLYGRNPNPKDPHNPDMIDEWRCAISWGPILQTQMAYEISCISREINVQREVVIPLMKDTFHASQVTADASRTLTKAVLDAQREVGLALPVSNGHATKMIEG